MSATTTISSLPSFSLPLTGTEKVPVDDGTTTRNVPASAVAALGAGLSGEVLANQAPYNGSIQAALNALPASGGTVRLSGQYHLNPPLLIQKSNVALVGEQALGKTNLINSFGAGPIVTVIGTGTGPTLVTALLAGSGKAWQMQADSDSNPGFYNLSEVYSCHIDGSAQLCVEAILKPAGVTGDSAAIVASTGLRTSADAALSAFRLRMSAGGHPTAGLKVGGTTYSLTGSSLTMAGGTTYHLALTYDGTTIRLFGGVSGGTCALLASQAASGTVTQAVEEDVTLGRELLTWPDGAGLVGPQDGCILDSVRISNVARYTAPFAGATAKFPNGGDANTLILINWVDFILDGGAHAGPPGAVLTGPLQIARNYNGNCYLAWKPPGFYAGPSDVRLQDLTISGGDVGLLMLGATGHDLDHLFFSDCRCGVKAVNNCFNGFLRHVFGDGASHTLAPSGRPVARAMLVYVDASTNCWFQDCGTSFGGWAYTYAGNGGFQWDYLRSSTAGPTVAHMLIHGDGSGNDNVLINTIAIDDEPSSTPSGYVAGVFIDGIRVVTFNGGGISTASSPVGNVCVKISGTCGSVNFNGVNFVGDLTHTTKVFDSGATPPGQLNYLTSVKNPAGIPWGS